METDYLYDRWQRDVSCQRWYLGMEPEEDHQEELYPCGFWTRFAAWVVDCVLINLVVLSVMASMILAGVFIFPKTLQAYLLLAFGAVLILFILKTAYFAILQGNNGQTIGQAVLGIKVVDIEGNPPSWNKALRRKTAHFFSVITFGIGYLWMVFDPKSQTFHDKITNTYVVYT